MKLDNSLIAGLIIIAATLIPSCDGGSDPVPLTVATDDATFTVAENSSNGLGIGTVTGSTNQGEVAFSILSQSVANALTIDANTGALTIGVANAFDFETNPQITAVVAVASGEVVEEASITVNVTDVQEIFADNINTSIKENPLSGTVLGTVSGSTTQGVLTMEINNVSVANSLGFNASTGAIMVNNRSEFDYESNNTITANVVLSNGFESLIIDVDINITDMIEAPTDGLLAAYTFNGGNANDDTANDYDATTVTATLTTDRFNKSNRAYAFSGLQYIEIGEYEAFSLNTISISLWFKSNSANAIQRLVFLGNDAQDRQNISLNYNVNSDGKCDFRYESDIPLSGGFIYSTSVLNDNEWHHLVGVRNGSTKQMAIYVDGILENSFTYINDPVQADSPLQFGRSLPGFSQYFTGTLDDVRIYSKVLSTSEIDLLYDEENID